MATLSEKEKQAMLEQSRSGELRRDMETLRHATEQRQAEYTLDMYLDFLNEMNEMIGHKRRPCTPITGDHFLL